MQITDYIKTYPLAISPNLADDVNYLSATVSFKYKMYEFALKNASNTTNTVT